MNSFRFGKVVEKIVIAHPDGDAPPSVLYARKDKKKVSPGLRTLEKAVHGAFDAQQKLSEVYESAHDRSDEEKKDGWLLDLPTISVRPPVRR